MIVLSRFRLPRSSHSRRSNNQGRASRMAQMAARPRAAWAAGSSVLALTLMRGLCGGASARPLFGGGNSGIAATTAAMNAANAAQQQAQQLAKQIQSTISWALQSMQAVQAAARAAAAATQRSNALPQVNVPNGLGAGG